MQNSGFVPRGSHQIVKIWNFDFIIMGIVRVLSTRVLRDGSLKKFADHMRALKLQAEYAPGFLRCESPFLRRLYPRKNSRTTRRNSRQSRKVHHSLRMANFGGLEGWFASYLSI